MKINCDIRFFKICKILNSIKSGKSTNNTSLKKYNEKNDNELAIRFSMNNLKKDGKVLNIPLFMVQYIEKMIKQSLSN